MEAEGLEAVAKAIFDECKSQGIEEMYFDSEWLDASEKTREIYREIAVKAIEATRRQG